MNKKQKIIHVYPQLNCGGTETVMFNLLSKISRTGRELYILAQREGTADDKFKEIGCNIIYLPYTNKKDYNKNLKILFQDQHFDIIHTHTHSEMGAILKIARETNIPLRIAHSHNDRPDLNKIYRFLHSFKTVRIQKNANSFIACSNEAARWLFPFKYKIANILLNGIDLSRFQFNPKSRERLRKEWGIGENTIVALHVGRHSNQKNPFFLLELAENLKRNDFRLVLVGDGPLHTKMMQEIDKRNLKDCVICLGERQDVEDMYSASDIFLLPSLHEGLGIVAIEAQSSGIKCVASEGVPMLADIGINLFKRLSLFDKDRWLNEILSTKPNLIERGEISLKAMNCKYNIEEIALQLDKIYCQTDNNRI